MAAAASSVIPSSSSSSSSSSSYLAARSLSEFYSLHHSSTNTNPSSSSAAAPSTPTSESALTNKSTKFYGWIRRIRSGDAGNVVFIDVYDGTYVGDFKGVAAKASYQGESFIDPDSADDLAVQDVKEFKILPYDDLTRAEKLSDGCAVVLDGKLVIPEKATQPFEMQVYRVRLIGGVSDPKTYPIQKTSEKQVVTLRNYPFMRLRAQVMQCLFRITSKLEMGIHEFMDTNDVIRIDPNILTTSDCEGAGETFQVLPKMFSKDSKGEEVGVGLTVSSQLPLESGITGFKQVYTAQKSFRAEKSDTIKHLAEFYHIEYEGAFLTLDKLLSFTESMVKYVIRYAFNKCAKDFAFLESKLSATDVKPARELLTELLDKPFIRIKHCDAITLIEKLVKEKFMLPDEKGELKRVKLDKLPRAGEDIGSEHEKLLVKYFGWMSCSEEEKKEKLEKKKEFGAFVFLTHWPIKIKSFYMKQCDDGSGECESFDLLAPRVGELFGGSMREWRFDKLDEEVKRRGMDISPIQWFLDLRKSGSMPHGGWGMGFARFACLVTGAPSVRDVVFLPVYYGHCPY